MHLYKMKKLLVCTDFSPASDTVLKAAEELRQRADGTLHVLHVSELGFNLESVPENPEKQTYKSEFLSTLKNTMNEKILDQIKRCGCKAEVLYKDGNVTDVIMDVAEKESFDMIITGHGRGPVLSQILGSTAYKLISRSKIPVFVAKGPVNFEKVAGLVDESRPLDKTVIGAFDFHRSFKFSEISFISLKIDFPEPFGNSESTGQIYERVQEEVDHFAPVGVKAKVNIIPTRELKPAIPLERALKSEKVGVAVIKKFSEGDRNRIYLGSTSKRLLEIFEGNILILPP